MWEQQSVECDNYQGGVLAAKHLIERGCKHLIHFSGIEDERMPADDRCRGFSDICEEKRDMAQRDYV